MGVGNVSGGGAEVLPNLLYDFPNKGFCKIVQIINLKEFLVKKVMSKKE